MTSERSSVQREMPLKGLRVADFSRVLAGPYCTMTLADFGAEVIKIESPQGDETRAWTPPVTDEGVGTYFSSVNRNKKSVVCNLNIAADREYAMDLIGNCDILIENFRPGVMQKFSFDYPSIKAANPRLIYCSISGFGDLEGADLPGYDLLVQALGGLMSITGQAEGDPHKAGVALVDVLAAQNATIGILLALRQRDLSGHGQHVKISLFSSLLAALTNQVGGAIATGVSPERLGNAHPSIAPYEVFATGGGIIAIGAGNDKQFALLARVLGMAHLLEDDRFVDNLSRVSNRTALKELLEGGLRSQTAETWQARLMNEGVPAGKVNSITDALDFAVELGLNPVVDLVDCHSGRTSKQISSPIGLSASPAAYARVPPKLGEHQGTSFSTLHQLGEHHDSHLQ